MISLLSKGLSRVFSSTTVQKGQFFAAQPSLWLSSHIHTFVVQSLSCAQLLQPHELQHTRLPCPLAHLGICLNLCTHSSTLAWRIPWMKEPGRLAVHGVAKSQTRLSVFIFTFTFIHWRRKWQPTPVFLPGESQGRGSPVGCHLWGRTESDTIKAT